MNQVPPLLAESICLAGQLPRLPACTRAPEKLRLADRAVRMQRLLGRTPLARRPHLLLRRTARVVRRVRRMSIVLAGGGELSPACMEALDPRLNKLTTMIGTLRTSRY